MKPSFALVVAAALAAPLDPALLTAQAASPADAITRALPADVARRILAGIADVRARGLPADLLARRALELSAKGVPPARIETAVADEAADLAAARDALVAGGRPGATDDELDAAGTALGKGVDGHQVSQLARSAASGRSLAVPLFVISSLVDRGLPSDEALRRVLARLEAKASDGQLAGLASAPGQADQAGKLTGLDMAETRRPAEAGRPAWVPANATAAAANRPLNPGRQGPGKP
ncbi:MAG TPA: hypothetical protein VF830_06905 [Gemmatimonadales bacterium]